jgi:hemolysin activation/secretion protein
MRRFFVAAVLAVSVGTNAWAQAEARLAVTGYRVKGDNPLSPGETQSILAPFAGEAVSIGRLQAAAAALEAALRERGYSFMRVVLPPQDVGGTIVLRVLSFRLGAVNVAGNKYFDAANVRRSLPSLRPGETPNLREVARNQAHVNDHPAKQVQVNMRQGKARDTVDADVQVEDSEPLHFFASLNNSGAAAESNSGVGRSENWRLGFGVSHANLFDRDHAVTATWTTGPSLNSNVQQYGAYYRAPFYALGGTLAAYYTQSDSRTGTVAEFFQVSGRGQFGGLRWTQRFAPIGAWSHAAEIGLEDRLFENNVAFNGVPIGVDVRSRPLLLRHEGRYEGAGYQLGHALEFAYNLGGGRANDDAGYAGNRAGATPDWQAWRYTLQASGVVFSDWVASARLRGQWSSDALIPGEQFGIGGAAMVRGLEEREGVGDRGTVVSVELMTPPLAEGLRALAFVDAGWAKLLAAGGAAGLSRDAASAGVGLRWQWRKQLSLSLDWANVFDAAGGIRRNDERLHLSVAVRF